MKSALSLKNPYLIPRANTPLGLRRNAWPRGLILKFTVSGNFHLYFYQRKKISWFFSWKPLTSAVTCRVNILPVLLLHLYLWFLEKGDINKCERFTRLVFVNRQHCPCKRNQKNTTLTTKGESVKRPGFKISPSINLGIFPTDVLN